MERPDLPNIRKRARMTNWHKEADVLTLCDYIEYLEGMRTKTDAVATKQDAP